MIAKQVRLSEKTLKNIQKIFPIHFSSQDTLWLSGSKVDPNKKGGDIDLYIETDLANYDIAIEKKIGDQKIDVVLRLKNSDYMSINNINKFNENMKTADIHANKIIKAINKLNSIFPITAQQINNLSEENFLLIELLISRFSKLQDFMETELIDSFLEYKGEITNNLTMIDKIKQNHNCLF